MRIKSIDLAWFRGAAHPVTLGLAGKSMVVYGANGSGKSSFVDAIEYVIKGGRLEHLTHEYSGSRQEKGVLNTHKPEDLSASLGIVLVDASMVKIEVSNDGSRTILDGDERLMEGWDYRRTVLRQGEIGKFIHGTKGEKYSALLPLLGLQRLEFAAENLRQLARSIEEEAGLKTLKGRLLDIDERRKKRFGRKTTPEILTHIGQLHSNYCNGTELPADPMVRCSEVADAIQERIGALEVGHRKHSVLLEICKLEWRPLVRAIRNANAQLADSTEPMIEEKLAVLDRAAAFGHQVQDRGEVVCPACGREIGAEDFKSHVDAEQQRLHGIRQVYRKRESARGELSDVVNSFKTNLLKPEVGPWVEEIKSGSLADSLSHLNGIEPSALRKSCGEQTLVAIEKHLATLQHVASIGAESSPPAAVRLSEDKEKVKDGTEVVKAIGLSAKERRVTSLVRFVNLLERRVREVITSRSQASLQDLSNDIQSFWAILHPDNQISGVQLYSPSETAKAIDVSLVFHGVEQDSPRLTLSEGFRNSLGLCVFLAMAKRAEGSDRPIVLDDVVVSLDREHRGMVRELLEREFGNRQVVVFTHDRVWYTELRQTLDTRVWALRALLPYKSPEEGVRWSETTSSFEDARAHLEEDPASAAREARIIMDIELALVAEKLRLRLPFLRGDKNDMRHAFDLLERLIKDGESRFKQGFPDDPNSYMVAEGALDALREAKRLLVSWGNRASHTFDVVRAEATTLIDACESVLEVFNCSNCGIRLWAMSSDTGRLQCRCGRLRWQ